jgi:hypothetical protein
MSFRFTRVRRFKRGAKHSDGSPWYCVTCGSARGRRRRNQAVVTAIVRQSGSPYKLPVGYCDDHIPEEVQPI